ncbi:MAG: hypothetical protein EZS28_043073, partial [Streblomastix strix]
DEEEDEWEAAQQKEREDQIRKDKEKEQELERDRQIKEDKRRQLEQEQEQQEQELISNKAKRKLKTGSSETSASPPMNSPCPSNSHNHSHSRSRSRSNSNSNQYNPFLEIEQQPSSPLEDSRVVQRSPIPDQKISPNEFNRKKDNITHLPLTGSVKNTANVNEKQQVQSKQQQQVEPNQTPIKQLQSRNKGYQSEQKNHQMLSASVTPNSDRQNPRNLNNSQNYYQNFNSPPVLSGSYSSDRKVLSSAPVLTYQQPNQISNQQQNNQQLQLSHAVMVPLHQYLPADTKDIEIQRLRNQTATIMQKKSSAVKRISLQHVHQQAQTGELKKELHEKDIEIAVRQCEICNEIIAASNYDEHLKQHNQKHNQHSPEHEYPLQGKDVQRYVYYSINNKAIDNYSIWWKRYQRREISLMPLLSNIN